MRRLPLAVLLLAAPAALAQPGADDVRIKTTVLGHGVYMLEGRGGHIGVSAGCR